MIINTFCLIEQYLRNWQKTGHKLLEFTLFNQSRPFVIPPTPSFLCLASYFPPNFQGLCSLSVSPSITTVLPAFRVTRQGVVPQGHGEGLLILAHTVYPCYNGPRYNGNLVVPEALTSQSHLAITDKLKFWWSRYNGNLVLHVRYSKGRLYVIR